jgi:hypothetical protein
MKKTLSCGSYTSIMDLIIIGLINPAAAVRPMTQRTVKNGVHIV